jgi:hypothetical protein
MIRGSSAFCWLSMNEYQQCTTSKTSNIGHFQLTSLIKNKSCANFTRYIKENERIVTKRNPSDFSNNHAKNAS